MGYRVAIAGRSNADSTPLPYDEMLTADGLVRPHYSALDQRVAALGDQELADRQRTLERFFLLQGITFTVYGGESSTERIIPRTFSSITAWGRHSSTNLRASGKRSRSSSAPSCLPTLEKGGHGTPPATKSTPLKGFPLNCLRSPSTTFQLGRLSLSVSHAAGSSSTRAS